VLRLRLPACALGAALISLGAAGSALSTHVPTIPIGQVQGAVADTADGATHRSPFAPPTGNGNGQTVAVQGVITQNTLVRTSSGGNTRGFFLQDTTATADADPTTSDGIFVVHFGFTTLLRDGGGSYTPQMGDEVVLRGPVAEFFSFTQLVNPRLIHVVRTGVDVDAEAPVIEANPPDSLAAANRYWERHEGMRLRVPAGARAIDGRDVFPSTADGEAWVMRGDHPLAARPDPYTRRSFRDPHPLDNHPEALFDDGNGYRILLASHGLKAAANDNATLIAPTRTFDTITNELVGGLNFAFSKYQVEVGEQPALVHGVEPAGNAPPTAPNRHVEYTLADYNVENLYDFRDDPNDGCDFAGNAGCPGVNPPFDFVPASDAEYQERLGLIAEQIVDSLHAPDVLMVQEAEDQDICVVASGALSCGSADNADGKPDTLQELTLAIRREGGPAYDAAYDRNGADARGIVAAFLYRTDRVQLRPVSADDPVFGSAPQVVYRGTPLPYNADVQNPKALNAVLPADVDRTSGVDGNNVYTRAPQVGSFRIWRIGVGRGGFVDLYAISNHFSSGPDTRVGQRREQSAYNAAIIDVLERSNTRVISAGDFNVFPRPDDPFAPGHPRYPSDQLGPLYDQGLNNLSDVEVREEPEAAYSYVFVGQAQTLDHQFVTDALLDDLVQARTAHVNADYPADFAGDGAFGLSDHDPMVSRYSLAPTLGRLQALLAFSRSDADPHAFKALQEKLDRAERFAASGQTNAYLAQLQAFANQARGFAPNHLSQATADSLADEADLLRTS
jgi:hypothetical protein